MANGDGWKKCALPDVTCVRLESQNTKLMTDLRKPLSRGCSRLMPGMTEGSGQRWGEETECENKDNDATKNVKHGANIWGVIEE